MAEMVCFESASQNFTKKRKRARMRMTARTIHQAERMKLMNEDATVCFAVVVAV